VRFAQIAVLVEGQTEQAFVFNVLAPHLQRFGIHAQPIVVQTSRTPAGFKRSGGGRWSHYARDLKRLLAATQYSVVTTMIDFYGYPKDAPGSACCSRPHVPRDCVARRVNAMAEEIGDRRFTPYLVLHEFETMIFGAAIGSSRLLGNASVAEALRAEAAKVGDDVELIDDNPETSPSKRIATHWPTYTKVTDGVAVVEEVGLPVVMDACHGLRAWIQQLETLGSPSSSKEDG
jgi:Domain of unknown function (DUF4276)